ALLAPGFFEYELTPAGDLLMTVLRSVGQLSRDDLPTRPGHAAWPTATPLAQCPGPARLQLSLCGVAAADLNGGTALPELWEDVFLPVRGVWLRQATSLRIPPGDLRLEGDGLVFSALKPSADGVGVILRCYNATDRTTRGAWRFPRPVASARRVRADEREGVDLALDDGGGTVRFSAAARELVTIWIAPSH
ncbi:MAG: glycosyl hydrolase-related protein, partial [Gemmatimonadales bacterium]